MISAVVKTDASGRDGLLFLVVEVESSADVLDDGFGGVGGASDDVDLLGGSFLHGESVPLVEQVALDECEVLGCLEVLEGFDVVDFVLLDVDLQGGGAGVAFDVLGEGGGVDDGHAVFLRDDFLSGAEAHESHS